MWGMRKFVSALIGLSLCAPAALYLFTPIEQFRLQSPDGNHTAVVSSFRLWQWIPSLPGDAGDMPGRVEIFDKSNTSLGSMPLTTIAMARDLQWIEQGARIRLVGSWNFQQGFYAYWNDDQSQLVFKQVN